MSDDPTFNEADKQVIRDNMTLNLMMRNDLIKGLADPRRDIASECGWPEVNAVSADQYKQFYEQNAFAERCIEIYPHECWQIQPTVFETEDTDNQTEFEKAWKELPSRLNENSYYQDEQGSNIWRFLKRIDVLCGIGTYGILLLGLSDVGKDERSGETVTLQDPAPGFGENEESKKVQSDNVTLKFLRVFDQSQAYITKFDSDPFSPRYGYPLEYTITFNDTDTLPVGTGSMSQPKTDMQVHWSRVIHIADNLDASEIYGSPRLRSIVPQILDILKLYGAQGEGYWRGAFPGLAVEADPSLGTADDVEIDRTEIKKELKDYANRLQRTISLIGMSVKTLAPIVVDGSAQINSCIEAICIKLGCPKRVFMGSEVGELASSQDTGRWEGRLNERRNAFVTPAIVVPFVDRLIQTGVLPEPAKGYSVSWKQRDTLSPQEKAQVAMTMVQAIVEYVNGGGEVLMSPKDFLVNVLGLTVEEADATLENTLEYLDMEERGDTRITDLMADPQEGTQPPKKEEPKTNAKKYDKINFKPPASVAKVAEKALDKRKEQSPSNRGGTAVGVARAGQLARRSTLSPETVKRMYSFFSRHEVDKKAKGFNSGEEGYPSKGRQAWDLWGGDSGFSWAKKVVKQMKAADMKHNTQGRTDSDGGHTSDDEYHTHDEEGNAIPVEDNLPDGHDDLISTPSESKLNAETIAAINSHFEEENYLTVAGKNNVAVHHLMELGMWDEMVETQKLSGILPPGTSDKDHHFRAVMQAGDKEQLRDMFLATWERKGWDKESWNNFINDFDNLKEERNQIVKELMDNDEIALLVEDRKHVFAILETTDAFDEGDRFLAELPLTTSNSNYVENLYDLDVNRLRSLRDTYNNEGQLAFENAALFDSLDKPAEATQHEMRIEELKDVLTGSDISVGEIELLENLEPREVLEFKKEVRGYFRNLPKDTKAVDANIGLAAHFRTKGMLLPDLEDYSTLDNPIPQLPSEGVMTREDYQKRLTIKGLIDRSDNLSPIQKDMAIMRLDTLPTNIRDNVIGTNEVTAMRNIVNGDPSEITPATYRRLVEMDTLGQDSFLGLVTGSENPSFQDISDTLMHKSNYDDGELVDSWWSEEENKKYNDLAIENINELIKNDLGIDNISRRYYSETRFTKEELDGLLVLDEHVDAAKKLAIERIADMEIEEDFSPDGWSETVLSDNPDFTLHDITGLNDKIKQQSRALRSETSLSWYGEPKDYKNFIESRKAMTESELQTKELDRLTDEANEILDKADPNRTIPGGVPNVIGSQMYRFRPTNVLRGGREGVDPQDRVRGRVFHSSQVATSAVQGIPDDVRRDLPENFDYDSLDRENELPSNGLFRSLVVDMDQDIVSTDVRGNRILGLTTSDPSDGVRGRAPMVLERIYNARTGEGVRQDEERIGELQSLTSGIPNMYSSDTYVHSDGSVYRIYTSDPSIEDNRTYSRPIFGEAVTRPLAHRGFRNEDWVRDAEEIRQDTMSSAFYTDDVDDVIERYGLTTREDLDSIDVDYVDTVEGLNTPGDRFWRASQLNEPISDVYLERQTSEIRARREVVDGLSNRISSYQNKRDEQGFLTPRETLEYNTLLNRRRTNQDSIASLQQNYDRANRVIELQERVASPFDIKQVAKKVSKNSKLRVLNSPNPNVRKRESETADYLPWEIDDSGDNVEQKLVIRSEDGSEREFKSTFSGYDGSYTYTFGDDEDSYTMTGGGDAKQVLRKVSTSMTDAVTSLKMKAVDFTASGRGRVGAYRFMAKKASRDSGYVAVGTKKLDKPKKVLVTTPDGDTVERMSDEPSNGSFGIIRGDVWDSAIANMNTEDRTVDINGRNIDLDNVEVYRKGKLTSNAHVEYLLSNESKEVERQISGSLFEFMLDPVFVAELYAEELPYESSQLYEDDVEFLDEV